jgi:predicted naringenin-chalcone synthase
METGSKASRIISIGTAVPEYSITQDAALGFMHKEYRDPTASRKLNVLFHQSAINCRYSVVPDFADSDERKLFPLTHEMPMVSERIDVFKQNALPLAVKAIENSFKNISVSIAEFGITHLITVTCTGLHNPGLDTELMQKLELPPDIFHTSVNFIGCNAAFPALKIADSFVKSNSDARVLVVCVELCTLHFQPKNDIDNLLSNTIFGDGAAAVIMVPDAVARAQNLKGFLLNGFSSMLFGRGKDLMGWNITPVNFEMILDAGIPDFFGQELGRLMAVVKEKLQLTPENIDHWAVHPGGKKILETVQRGLQLKNDDLKHSYEVLRNYGNMSSPTILFVLNEIFKSNPQNGETLFALGFGPGISIETASMTCHGFV